MKIAIGNDHAATELKFIIMDYAKSLGHEVVNFGTDGNESCNYPEFGEKVGRAVVSGEADCGILICVGEKCSWSECKVLSSMFRLRNCKTGKRA